MLERGTSSSGSVIMSIFVRRDRAGWSKALFLYFSVLVDLFSYLKDNTAGMEFFIVLNKGSERCQSQGMSKKEAIACQV